MKIRQGYITRKIKEKYVIVPVGDRLKSVAGIIELNESAALLWDVLVNETTYDVLESTLEERYSISNDVAHQAVESFLLSLKKYDILQE